MSAGSAALSSALGRQYRQNIDAEFVQFVLGLPEQQVVHLRLLFPQLCYIHEKLGNVPC